MAGLKTKLNELIRDKGYVSLDEVYKVAAEGNYKQKTAERCLDKSNSPQIEPIYNEKKHKIGYKWLEMDSSQTADKFFQDFPIREVKTKAILF